MPCPNMHIPFFGREAFYPNIFVYEMHILSMDFGSGLPYNKAITQTERSFIHVSG